MQREVSLRGLGFARDRQGWKRDRARHQLGGRGRRTRVAADPERHFDNRGQLVGGEKLIDPRSLSLIPKFEHEKLHILGEHN